VQAAARVFEASHDVHRALAELELAIVADPADPSLRLGAAWLALEAGIPERARVHIDSGLARETEPHWRGQLLAAAARKPGRRPHVNLMMCDAY